MTELTKSCKECREHLCDLLLDPAAVPSRIATHLSACAACREELAALRATLAVLDAWEAPQPSAYFDTRLHARLREAQAAPPEGFFERMRAFFAYSTGRHLRSAVAGALALVLVAGTGSFVGVHGLHFGQPQASAAVNDLKILDNNAQALQQMDQLLDDSSDDNDASPTT
jgi:hypothetical protein